MLFSVLYYISQDIGTSLEAVQRDPFLENIWSLIDVKMMQICIRKDNCSLFLWYFFFYIFASEWGDVIEQESSASVKSEMLRLHHMCLIILTHTFPPAYSVPPKHTDYHTLHPCGFRITQLSHTVLRMTVIMTVEVVIEVQYDHLTVLYFTSLLAGRLTGHHFAF